MNKEEFLKKIETELKISKNADATIKNYLFYNEKLLRATNKQPEDMTIDDVKQFIADNLTEKAASSIILFLASIRYAYTSILNKDITASIKRPKKERKIPAVLTKEEVKRLIAALTNQKSKLMISLIYACGFRVSELVNLKPVDLEFEEKIGHARQAKGRKDRIFNIPDFLLNDLKKQAEQQRHAHQTYLFTGPKGQLSVRNLQKIVQTARKRAEIQKNVHPHTLRHSFATHLLESGTDIRMIQELLGHANLNTTQQYAHISAEQIKKVKSPIDTLNEMKEKEEK